MSMYFGNLNYRIKERDLERVLANYGNIISVKIVKDHNTGKSKGFGFVEIGDGKKDVYIVKIKTIVNIKNVLQN